MVEEKEEDTCDPLEVAWDELLLLIGALVEVVAFGGKEPTTDVRNDT